MRIHPIGAHVTTIAPEFERQLEVFLRLAGKRIYANPSLKDFSRWIRDTTPIILPALLSQIPDDPKEIQLFLAMVANNLYADFPLPALSLQPSGKIKQGRNDLCQCGSGQKFKNCCGNKTMPPLFGNLNLLRYVLDAYPKSKLPGVASTKASLDAVADVAYQWLQEGEEARGAALLEPYFAGDGSLNARLAPLFNLLMDTWLSLGKKGKREALVASIMQRGDKLLRSDALQRRTTMLADKGDHRAAWQTFKLAKELNPNDPALSFLEVTTLLSEGRSAEAQTRAQWWATFLSKQRDAELTGLIDRLRAIAIDPHAGMMGVAMEMNADWQRLNTLFAKAPSPVTRHKYQVLREADESDKTRLVADALMPDAKLAEIEALWRETFPQIKPELTRLQHGDESVWDSAPEWLDLLEKYPELWLSFEVLDDLVMAVDTIRVAGVEERLLAPMAERAAEQLRLTLEDSEQPNVHLPWGIFSHRPILRPIAHLAYICKEAAAHDSAKAQRFMELAHWLVFELNPNDNHGLRTDLSNCLVKFERWEEVIALNERYPGDMQPHLQLNALLALLVLQKSDSLVQKWKQAAKDLPTVVKMLLGPEPKQVKRDNPYGIAVGSKYEAWLYVQEMRAYWVGHHALDWARAVFSSTNKPAMVPPSQQSLL